MVEQIAAANSWLNGFVWGWPMIVLLLGTGVVLTVLTGAVQFRYLGFALKEVLGKITQKSVEPGSVSPFQAVATALASTVGVGNIAGVATAISIGGPGALLWLWVSGLLGMGTKFAEIVIALHYREKDETGVMRGGAMYTLKNGLGMPWLGSIFALLVSLAAFGIDTTVTGIILASLTAAVILGGIRRIGEVTEIMVPFMALFYLGGAMVILLRFAAEIPAAFALVFNSAFSGAAASGGFAGATVMMALRYGVARGLFSNEAGLGSAPMVHAAARTDHPVRQGLYGIFEVFVDTILVCTVTGLAILVTGVWDDGATGAALAGQAFSVGLPGTWGNIVVTTSLVLFAFSTLIGWSFYGETGIVYLFGAQAAMPYRLLWLVFIFIGARGSLHLVWDIADTLNGLMALPNLLSVLVSIPVLLKLTREFFAAEKVRAGRS